MIVKALVGAALLAAPASVAPAVPLLDQQIPKVVCPVYAGPVLLGWSMGSAFRIGKLLLSVKHVTDYPDCYINGKKITVAYTDPKLDFSIIADSEGPFLKVDCDGFKPGRKYLAVGHARGLDQLTTVELEGTGQTTNGYAILKGISVVIPGQSGGSIIDAETGKAVGMVNAYDMAHGLSYSIPLSETTICQP
jgi:hypothetical protein